MKNGGYPQTPVKKIPNQERKKLKMSCLIKTDKVGKENN
jgi:hypothetical protein